MTEHEPSEFPELEARLAAYGEVLRNELDEPDQASPVADLHQATVVPLHQRTAVGAGTATTKSHMRRGVLVAAVLALIAGVSFMSFRPDAPDAVVEVADSPTAVPGAAPAIDDAEPADEAEPIEPADDGPSEDESPDEAAAPAGDADADASDEPAAEPDQPDEPEEEPLRPGESPTCAVGTFVDGRCRVVGNPPVVSAPVCPTSGDVREDADGCYRVVAPTGQCLDPFETHDETTCRELVAKVTDASSCPEDAVLSDDGLCVRTVDGVNECPIGSPVGEWCIDSVPAISGGAGSCPTSGDHVVVDGECFRRVVPTCGDLEPSPWDPTLCKLPGTVNERVGCVAELGTIDGLCIVDGYQGVEFCPDGGTLIGSDCEYAQPAEGGFSCPVSDVVFETEGRCWTIVPFLPDGSCASIEPAPDGSGCIETVERVGTPLTCTLPWQLTGDPSGGPDFCSRFEPVHRACDDGDVDSAKWGMCAVLGDPPTTILTCVETGMEIIESSDQCWTEVAPSCPTSDCLEAVDVSIDGWTCPVGYDLSITLDVPRTCVRRVYSELVCDVGVPGPDLATCLVVSEPVELASCPDEPDIVEADGRCYRLVALNRCGGLAPIGDGCRSPVDKVRAAPVCDDGFELVDDECIRWEDPIPT